MHRRRQLGGEARIEVGIEHGAAQEVEAGGPHGSRPSARRRHFARDRMGGHPVRECDDLANEVRRRRPTQPARAQRREPLRHLLEVVAREGVAARRVGHRVEKQPLDVARVGERVGDRELRSVRRPRERDLVDSERLAYRVDVVDVVAGGVEGTARTGLRRAFRDERLLPRQLRERIGLELGTAKEAGTSGAARVEGDQCVAGVLAAEVDGVRAEGEGA